MKWKLTVKYFKNKDECVSKQDGKRERERERETGTE